MNLTIDNFEYNINSFISNINNNKYCFLNGEFINYDAGYLTFSLGAFGKQLPSPLAYIPANYYLSASHSHIFKAKYGASIIGLFVYNLITYLKLGIFFMRFSKKIIQYSMVKKQTRLKRVIDYKTKKVIFSKLYKHIILFFRMTYKRKMYKYRRVLWNQFYKIQDNFWTTHVKRKVKSFIWKVLNIVTFLRRSNLNNKQILWKHKLFHMNYYKITLIIYSIIKKKRYPKKLWLLLLKHKKRKKKSKKSNFRYTWMHYLRDSIVIDRKNKYYLFNNLNTNNIYFTNDYTVSNISTSKNVSVNTINRGISVGLLLNSQNNNYMNFLHNELKVVLSLYSNSGSVIYMFFTNYILYQFFRGIHINLNIKVDVTNNFNYLKWFYKVVAKVYKGINAENIFIKTGIYTKIYKFFKLSHINNHLRLFSWFNTFYIDRDLNYFFVVNRLFGINKNILTLRIFNLFHSTLSILNNFSFIIKNIVINDLINNNMNLNVVDINNNSYTTLINSKEFNWVRRLYSPYVVDYRYILKDNVDLPISFIKNIEKEIYNIRKHFYFLINKGVMKYEMYSFINFNFFKYYNMFNLNAVLGNLNNTGYLYKNNLFSLLKNKYSIGVNTNTSMLNYSGRRLYRLHKRYKKLDNIVTSMSKRLDINKIDKYLNMDIIFNKNDQFLMNKYVHTYYSNKKFIRKWYIFTKNKLVLLENNNRKTVKYSKKISKHGKFVNVGHIIYENEFINKKRNTLNVINNRTQQRKYMIDLYKNICSKNNIIYNYSNKKYNFNVLWKNYIFQYLKMNLSDINIDPFFFIDINEHTKEVTHLKKNYYNNISVLGENRTVKNINTDRIKYINFNIDADLYMSRYLLNRKENEYLVGLWKMRKSSRLLEKDVSFDAYEYASRFFEKRRFINNYNVDYLYKELFVEYSRRLHIYNDVHVLDSYERSFEKSGPLSFYYNDLVDLGNLKAGINIRYNFILNVVNKNIYLYIKPFFNMNICISKILLENIFYPIKVLYLYKYTYLCNNYNTNNMVLSNMSNDNNIVGYLYKQWNINVLTTIYK
jgi:hypothetical protein